MKPPYFDGVMKFEDTDGFGILSEGQAIGIAKNVNIDQGFNVPKLIADSIKTEFAKYQAEQEQLAINSCAR